MSSKNKLLFFVSAFLLFIFPSSVSAQVAINEINPSGEWIELFKTSPGAVTLEGCTLYFHSLDSSTSNTQKKFLTISDNFLESEEYKVISSGGSWLSNSSSDTVSLDCPSYDDGPHTYGEDLDTKSFARIPNGTGSFIILSQSSQGSVNVSPPTPSPTPTSSPTPTATPTQTPTPTPTKSPTPIPTKTPTPKPSSISTPTSSPQAEVLGEATSAPTPTDSPMPIVEGIFVNKPPILAFVLVAVGVLLMGVSGYLSFKKIKETGV